MLKQMKYSKQREALLSLLKSVNIHPSAEWLYVELKKDFPNMSMATVYRNLAQLCDSGEVIKLDVGSGREHYDADTRNHYHFVCKKCLSIYDIDMPYMSEIDMKVGTALNADIDDHALVFYGTCEGCMHK